MVLNERDRELLERALDALALAHDGTSRSDALVIYRQAIRLVRDVPIGSRRVRSDFNQKRRGPQMEFGA